jgi:hypothetical protein
MFHSACHESPRSTFHRFCASHLWIVLLTFSHKTSVTGIHYFILFPPLVTERIMNEFQITS